MRKILIATLFLIPGIAMAEVDISDCEVIGHERGIITEAICETVEKCNTDFADDPEDLERCLSRVKSPEDCAKDVAQRNEDIESKNLLYRCPATSTRIAQKDNEKISANHNLIYTDGTDVDIDALIADKENVFLFQGGAGMAGFFNKGKFNIIGPKDKDGLFMAIFE
ncbi:MAG: hypothetical protein IKM94_04325 [Alphaproteobacteria bacterium]|nr:hypothetical protein [Alphaproteobacteria bacterium]